jgi:hypothetical protein
MQTFRTLIQLGIEQGDVSEHIDPDRLAQYIIPSYTGVQLVSDTLHKRSDLFDRVRDMWELLIPALIVPDRIPEALSLLKTIKR